MHFEMPVAVGLADSDIERAGRRAVGEVGPPVFAQALARFDGNDLVEHRLQLRARKRRALRRARLRFEHGRRVGLQQGARGTALRHVPQQGVDFSHDLSL